MEWLVWWSPSPYAGLRPRPDAISSAPPSLEVLSEPGHTLLAELRGEQAIGSWGKSWSQVASQVSVEPPAQVSGLVYPRWLVGDWQVSAKLKDVSFPQGRRFVNDRLPGFRMASILLLPNVGNEPKYTYSIGNESGECRKRLGKQHRTLFLDTPQLSGNLFSDSCQSMNHVLCCRTCRRQLAGSTLPQNSSAILEAFWPDARVVSAVSNESSSQLTLTYEAPTLRAKVCHCRPWVWVLDDCMYNYTPLASASYE